MRVLTVVVIVIIAVVVTMIATTAYVRRPSSASWIDSVLGRAHKHPHRHQHAGSSPPSPSSSSGGEAGEAAEAAEPGLLERVRSVIAATAATRTEDRHRILPRDRHHDHGDAEPEPRPLDGDGSRTSGRSRAPGDAREKQKKLAYEARCREILERIFGVSFPRTRPAWLRNDERGTGTMRKLELDCYSEQLSLALEYNGRQHRVYPNTFHETKQQFEDQKRRDKLKVRRCAEEGVRLIIVPDTVDYEDLYAYVTERLEALGVVEIVD
jgi:hypothetical protein